MGGLDTCVCSGENCARGIERMEPRRSGIQREFCDSGRKSAGGYRQHENNQPTIFHLGEGWSSLPKVLKCGLTMGSKGGEWSAVQFSRVLGAVDAYSGNHIQSHGRFPWETILEGFSFALVSEKVQVFIVSVWASNEKSWYMSYI